MVIEVGAAECAHEEIVGKRVLLRPLPQLHAAAVEIAHDIAADRRHRREHVVLAAIDLLDRVVVGVDRAEQHVGRRFRDRRRIDAERRVRQLRIVWIRLALCVPDTQVGQLGAVVVALDVLLLGGIGDAIGTGKQPVEVIEAAVLRIEDDNGLNLREIGRKADVPASNNDRARRT